MNDMRSQLEPVRVGLVLGLVAVLYGWSLGILFGAGEHWLRQGFIRAHLHAGAIGSIAIGGSVALALLGVSARLKTVASTLLGLGSVGYSVFWMWAGLRAPTLGSTGAAKESLRWLAWPSSGALMVGALLTIALVTGNLFLGRTAGPKGAE